MGTKCPLFVPPRRVFTRLAVQGGYGRRAARVQIACTPSKSVTLRELRCRFRPLFARCAARSSYSSISAARVQSSSTCCLCRTCTCSPPVFRRARAFLAYSLYLALDMHFEPRWRYPASPVVHLIAFYPLPGQWLVRRPWGGWHQEGATGAQEEQCQWALIFSQPSLTRWDTDGRSWAEATGPAHHEERCFLVRACFNRTFRPST